MIGVLIYYTLAFIDNSSRGPSRKKRASQTENQDEPYVDVKVFIWKVFQIIRMGFCLESIDARHSSRYSTGRSNVHVTEHVNGRLIWIEIRLDPFFCFIRI